MSIAALRDEVWTWGPEACTASKYSDTMQCAAQPCSAHARWLHHVSGVECWALDLAILCARAVQREAQGGPPHHLLRGPGLARPDAAGAPPHPPPHCQPRVGPPRARQAPGPPGGHVDQGEPPLPSQISLMPLHVSCSPSIPHVSAPLTSCIDPQYLHVAKTRFLGKML